MSGLSSEICRSNRPGRSRALSKMSGRFVPARMTTPEVVANPSISTSSWFSVFSLSSLPPMPPLPLCLPMASISSMKMIEGDCDRALAKRSLTRAGPTPTNISIKSDPLMDKNGTPLSPAVALASRVFPVPGGPTSSAPLGMRAPSSWYLEGFFKNWTNSMISALASVQPATSLKVTLVLDFGSAVVMLALPTLKMRPMPPPPPGPPPSPPPIWRDVR
mmetsp:Transcript_15322/g.31778  ORF Transcript_15322/g.31778 Transcript_15322/m.31778 type:complete len:218 (-) Transcript_15322:1162-1815(-)